MNISRRLKSWVRFGLLTTLSLTGAVAFARGGQIAPGDTNAASHVIVYDVSGSMSNPTTALPHRYLVAQAAVRALVRDMHNSTTDIPMGMVILGRKYPSRLMRCDDIEVPVTVAPIQGTDTLDHIEREAMNSTASGETPLVDAMVRAAMEMPEAGGWMTVITDLQRDPTNTKFDTVCEADPCIDFKQKLQDLRRSPGFEDRVKIKFIISSGLRTGTEMQAVERVAQCTGAKMLEPQTAEDAGRAGDEVALALTSPVVAAPAPPPHAHSDQLPPSQSFSKVVQVAVKLDWAKPIVLPNWRFDEIGALIDFFYLSRKSAPVHGDQAVVPLADGYQAHLQLKDQKDLGLALSKDITAAADPPVHFLVEPSPLQINVALDPPGQLMDDFVITGTVQTGRDSVPYTGAHNEFLVPPGMYTITATVQRRSGGAPVTASENAVVRYAQPMAPPPIRVVMAPPPIGAAMAPPQMAPPETGVAMPPANGRLSAAFVPTKAQTASPSHIIVKDNLGNVVADTTSAFSDQSLAAGRYTLSATTGSTVIPVPNVSVTVNATTQVLLFPPLGRLILHVQGGDDTAVDDVSISWRVRSETPGSPMLESTGSVFDRGLPAGRYSVEVWNGSDRKTETFEVPEGSVTNRAIALKR